MRRLRAISVLVALTVVPGAVPAHAAIKIKRIEFNPSGPDDGSNEHLNREYVLFKNTGTKAKNLSGWKVFDAGRDHTYTFEDVTVEPDMTIRLMSGQGKDIAISGGTYVLHWNLDNYVWNNDGDRARLIRPNGNVVDQCAYIASADSPHPC